MRSLFTCLFFLFALQLNSFSQRIVSPAVPVNWTERESEAEIHDWFALQRIFPSGNIDHQALKNAKQNFLSTDLRAHSSVSWQNVGPLNIGGRMTDVEMIPSSGTMYISAASGGIFRSYDAGNTWAPIFDAQPSLSMGDLDISKSDTAIMFAGTGEPNAGGGSLTYDGSGVFKSMDGGNTWISCGLDSTRNTGRIAIDPKNPNRVFAATMGDLFANSTQRGLYRTTDAGQSWQKIFYQNDSSGVIEIAINPINTDTVYCSSWTRVRRIDRRNYGGPSSALWRSYDGGNTWAQLTNGLPAGYNYGRTCIQISESQPNIVYAMISDDQSTFQGVYKSTDYGDSWARTNDLALGDVFSGSSHWEGRIKIDPVNPDVVYLIGFDVYQTLDGGNNWANITSGYHPDCHEIYVNPANNNELLHANDGGLFASFDQGFNWYHFDNLPVSQMYTCEVDERFPYMIGGGLQDNGVNITLSGLPNDYNSIWGGDGFYLQIDPNNSSWYMESQFGNINTGTQGIDPLDRFNWNTPIEFNHKNTQSLFIGSNHVNVSYDEGNNWQRISPDLTNHTLSGYPITWGTVTSISNSPVDSSIIYAGTDDGQFWFTTNYGNSWTNSNPTPAVRWITRVTADPVQASVVYCTISGYRFHDNVAHVYRSNDYGNTWISIDGNLPDVPCNDILVDPVHLSTLFVATDVGVYISDNLGVTWLPLGNGMPSVPVTDLRLHWPTKQLFAATYGRSIYSFDLAQFYVGVETPEVYDMKIFPNPLSEKSRITFSSVSDDNIELCITDVLGKVISSLNIPIKAGFNSFKFPEDLRSGIYFLTMKNQNFSLTEKIISR
jgi:photosystem II stability/assembly factor-like uncharacterized protein